MTELMSLAAALTLPLRSPETDVTPPTLIDAGHSWRLGLPGGGDCLGDAAGAFGRPHRFQEAVAWRAVRTGIPVSGNANRRPALETEVMLLVSPCAA
jgi:hypothetical protein